MSKKLSRKQKRQMIANDTVKLIQPDIINAEDKQIIADKCYHNDEACEIGTYNSKFSKYAVYYRNRWFFAVYCRDENKVSSMIDISLLSNEDILKFTYYKNRMEQQKRAQRVRRLDESEIIPCYHEDTPTEEPSEQPQVE